MKPLQKNTCIEVYFLIDFLAPGLLLYYKKRLTEEFSCEFLEIFQNSFFMEHLLSGEWLWILPGTFAGFYSTLKAFHFKI